jgi:hypothetical protein
MSFQRKQKVEEFNKKTTMVTKALGPLLNRIEGMNVKPWNFGMDTNGNICGTIKIDEIGENDLNRLAEVSKDGFSVFIATNNHCYKITEGKVGVVDAYDGREYINNQITKFRMSLISL